MIRNPILAGAIVSLALLAATLTAQTSRRTIYSRPDIPGTAALQRLNLHLAWRNTVPVDGQRDALIVVELHDRDLIVLTRSGLIVRMDAETGVTHWRTRVGKPYTLLPYVATNSRSVYVIANAQLFSLDRGSGAPKWDYPLPAGISAAPAVDEEQIYVPTVTSRLYAFYLPFVTGGALSPGDTVVSAGETPRSSLVYGRRDTEERIRPRPVWVDDTGLQLLFRPLQSNDDLLVVSPSGQGMGFPKVPREGNTSLDLYKFNLDGKISVPGASFGDTAYLGADDASVYAFNMRNGKLRWRHTAGTSISRRPVALENDVFVSSEREGLARLDRNSGESAWRIPGRRGLVEANAEASRFLAANERFVYANDHSGRLLVLDRKRGVTLSMLDTTGFRVPVVNDVTDRLYLAANDGMIVCLHDVDQKEPIRQRLSLEEANSPVLKNLAQNVTEPGGKEVPLRQALLEMRKKYRVNFVPNQRAFKAANLPDPEERMVKLPRMENKPLKDYLARVLAQANATYQVVDQTVFIVPLPPKEKGKDKEK